MSAKAEHCFSDGAIHGPLLTANRSDDMGKEVLVANAVMSQ